MDVLETLSIVDAELPSFLVNTTFFSPVSSNRRHDRYFFFSKLRILTLSPLLLFVTSNRWRGARGKILWARPVEAGVEVGW